MQEKQFYASVVSNGTWLYDGSVQKDVRIVKRNWDYYFEEEFDSGEEKLNPDGELFFVEFGSQPSKGFFSLEEARAHAEKVAPGKILWTDDKLADISPANNKA
jgi:hypothetical protein